MAKKVTAKKKAAKKASAPDQTTVLVYVPDDVYKLGVGMQTFIGAMNFLWAKSFGVQNVRVEKNTSWP